MKCNDCGKLNDSYMVRNDVWRAAWPDYSHRKAEALRLYPKPDVRRHLLLCFRCLEKRLGRTLFPQDFDLTLPINSGICLGLNMLAAK
jgi:hypothetical protein